MAMNWLRQLAAKAPVPVYPLLAGNLRTDIQTMGLDPRIEWVASPRHARVLLVAGELSPATDRAFGKVHDQLPGPAASIWWQGQPLDSLADGATILDKADDLGRVAHQLQVDLLSGKHRGEPALCPDEPPEPWQGLGDIGHGGEGMMGGKPYGRSMAMPTDDLRDGLQLDPMAFSLGPFCSFLPPGLEANVTLHGDVVASFEVCSTPYPSLLPGVFEKALEGPVSITELELARARHYLHQLGHALWINQSGTVAHAVFAKARSLKPGESLNKLKKQLIYTGFYRSAGADKGVLGDSQALMTGGVAARACGRGSDARVDDDGYRSLGFKPLVMDRGDAAARWWLWLEEAQRSLQLAHDAGPGHVKTSNTRSVELLRGASRDGQLPEDGTAMLEDLLPGLEWSEAMAVLASLDLSAVQRAGAGAEGTL
ncbi:hypothetical protein [Marinobacter salicampi]|uniref:NADH-quinone oxidoreductase subunit D-related protein n=1 Tax=Marinobacter salicampi TaxID=435907 RepID=UPI00140909F1|nr:hypothetical protein [Marinobacter salicampi]